MIKHKEGINRYIEPPDTWLCTCKEAVEKSGSKLKPDIECETFWDNYIQEKEKYLIRMLDKKFDDKQL